MGRIPAPKAGLGFFEFADTELFREVELGCGIEPFSEKRFLVGLITGTDSGRRW